MKLKIAVAALALAASPALAQDATGDAAAGEAAYRQCATCHAVVAPDGTVIAGRANVRTGPNLFGAVGGPVAHWADEFRYGNSIKEYAETGAVWSEENFVKYVQDPTGYLREALGSNSARSNMTYKVRKEEDALNIYAYLASVAPAPTN